MKTAEEWHDAYFRGEATTIRELAELVQADARRAALESMITLINAESKEWQLGAADDETKGTAVEALSLVGCKVRAMLDAAPKAKHPDECPECGSITVDLECGTCCPEDR